jgi:hypothetical protein
MKKEAGVTIIHLTLKVVSTFLPDIKLPIGYSLIAPVDDILSQDEFSEAMERFWGLI